MTNKKSTRKALLSSVLALALCMAMLIGTTFAWFTDSVSSNNNKIVAGNLDVQLFMHNGTDYVDISESTDPIFGTGSLAQNNQAETLWEPGKTQVVYLAVKNAGSLSLKYNILVDVKDEGLVGALKYAIVDDVTKADVDAYGLQSWSDITAVDGVQVGDIVAGRTIAAENGGIEPKGYDYFALAVHMDELAGNEYKEKSVVIDINILATQMEDEEDSFDNTYDEGAELESTSGMVAKIRNTYYDSLAEAIDVAKDKDTVELLPGYNTQNEQLAETIVIDKEITLVPNGMYLVSNDESTFTVEAGGKLTVTEGSFTIKNTATNGAAVFVDGGEFVMAGGSFDAHTAVKTAEGKSSTVTIAAGWSNRVTKGIISNGDDVINVTGGTLISNQESIITEGKTEINISGGTLSGKPARVNMYYPSVVCNGETTINMTGGKVETTANQSIAISIFNNSKINLSGDAVVSGSYAGINAGGDGLSKVGGDNNIINISGNAKVTASGAGNSFKIGYAVDIHTTNTTINVSENAQIDGSAYGVYAPVEGCVVNVSDSAYIKANSSCPDGYGIGAPTITITGGTINAKMYGVCGMENSIVTIDNSQSGDSITITAGRGGVVVPDEATYIVAGNPVITP